MRFVLVHGGFHGAWCWERLVPELRHLGHDAVTMDLPGHGERREEHATLDGYCSAVVDVLRPGDVLVGHSMGCSVATIAADSFLDLRQVVYLAGSLPVEGRPIMSAGTDSESEKNASLVLDYEGARERFYLDCPPELVEWAFSNITPQQLDVLTNHPISVPRFWEAELPRSLIICTEDQSFPAARSQRQAERLGVAPLEIRSSHSPFLSRPADLAVLLVEAVETRPTGRLIPTA